MSAQHTPGPWKAGPVFQKDGGAVFITDTTKPGKWQHRLDDRSGVFRTADARLIAAAPDLLAALLPCVEYDGGNCLGDYPEKLAAARAAIAKATGAT